MPLIPTAYGQRGLLAVPKASLGEDPVAHDHLPEPEKVTDQSSETVCNDYSPSAEIDHIAESSTDSATVHATPDSCGTTTVGHFNPEAAILALGSKAGYIDFGTLVPEGSKNAAGAIHLRFLDDGRSTTSLLVGKSEQCAVRLEGEDIGDTHCSLELLLRYSGDTYHRVVQVLPIEPHRTTVNLQPEDASSQVQTPLHEDCAVRFGASDKSQYRHVLPQYPFPDPPCWATRLFTWDATAKPEFGGSRSNSSVYLVKTRGSNTCHAMKVIQTVRFSFNPALQDMVRREHISLSALNHAHVLDLQHFRRDEVHSRLVFVFTEMKGDNLQDFVVKHQKARDQSGLNKVAPKVAKQLLCGFSHIHSNDIAHRDLKPDNVFLAEDVSDEAEDAFKVVIGDFGIARSPREKTAKTAPMRNRRYQTQRQLSSSAPAADTVLLNGIKQDSLGVVGGDLGTARLPGTKRIERYQGRRHGWFILCLSDMTRRRNRFYDRPMEYRPDRMVHTSKTLDRLEDLNVTNESGFTIGREDYNASVDGRGVS
ncbi:hypothetical protein FRC01_004266 [Tulasnella sp. 417]|nr:hypothetical protein FRC01_004266 [Tulasnella sp. 417]